MATDLGVIAVWGDSYLELREDFKETLNGEFGDGISGVHTIYLCMYETGLVYVEPVMVSVYDDSPLFFFTDTRFVLKLDKDMNVEAGDFTVDADLFIRILYSEFTDVEHIGPLCTEKGFAWEMFTLNNPDIIENATSRYERDAFDQSHLTIDEDDIMDVAFEFLAWRKEKFLLELESAVSTEEDIDPSGNPFEDVYYARKFGGIRSQNVMISNTDDDTES